MRRKSRHLPARPPRIFAYLALAAGLISLPSVVGAMADAPRRSLRDYILDESRGYDIDSPHNTPRRRGYLVSIFDHACPQALLH